MHRRQVRGAESMGGREARYGVFLNIHHKSADKHVMLHKLPCFDYRHLCAKGANPGTYISHKDFVHFHEAVKKASKWSLDWHAHIKPCKKCQKNWK
jgi:hypothetical protein